jgi:diguanylate cyclase (GGDEF)-like protein
VAIRAVLVGPQLAAFLPAIMLGAYWFGGEGVLLTVAVIFPALMAFAGLVTRPGPRPHGRDSTTGLPDRQALVHHVDTALTPGAMADGDMRICLALEIDDIGRMQDSYGAEGVDRILRTCTGRLRDTLRDSDVIASLGRGAFGIALGKSPRVDLETMLQLAARLQDVLAAPVMLDAARVPVTASIGFALPSRIADQTGEAFVAAAESALDEAKRAGPGSVRAFAKGMRPRVELPDNIVKEVVHALEAGEFEAWFQPQISTDTAALSGFEALARWRHPDKGLVAPGAFLPAIAAAGLFERLGEVMLYQSLSAIREWDRAGLDVPGVALNLSSDELQNPKLFDRIRWELDRFDLDPKRLTLEVLEDVVARSDDDAITRNIAALSQLGCGIDLDDFGTGHASIANIRRFAVSRIKIDRSFVTHVDTDRDQQNMVDAILTMADRLGLDTVAEGVESHGEHAMLAQLGCRHVQGYSIAKPMPVGEVAGWIRTYRQKLSKPPRIPHGAA